VKRQLDQAQAFTSADKNRIVDAELGSQKQEHVPLGQRPGLQEPFIPEGPQDQGWSEWAAMCERVEASGFRPWEEERDGWLARDPVPPHKVQFFGKDSGARNRAYSWVHSRLPAVS
jgi:hypothetical protein